MKLNFDLLIARAPAPRDERLNVGVALFLPGRVFLRIETTPARIGALNANYPRLPVFKAAIDGSLADVVVGQLEPVRADPEASRMMARMLMDPIVPVHGGEIHAEDDEIEQHLDVLMDKLVRRAPVSVRLAASRKARGSRLSSQLTAWFRQCKIMGRHMDDLSRNRVVAEFPIAVDADVYADFAYKNGELNVIETLDLRGLEHMTTSVRNSVAFKAVTLDMARDVVGQGRRLGVVSASNYGAVKGAVRIFERNADDIFSVDSPNDRQRLADLLSSGLHTGTQLELPALS